MAAITEEFVCRGVVLEALSVKSTTFGLITSDFLLALMQGNFNQILNGFLLGLVMGYAAIKSKSIFLPILLHMCADGYPVTSTIGGLFQLDNKKGLTFSSPRSSGSWWLSIP